MATTATPPSAGRTRGWRTALELVARFVIAALFLYAAFGKLMDVPGFAQDVTNYRLLPETWATTVAVVLPNLEIVAALALLSGIGARGAALVCTLMFCAFTAGMAQALLRGIDLECGCFGRGTGTLVSGWTLARNVGLAALSAVPLVTGITPWGDLFRALRRDRTSSPPADPSAASDGATTLDERSAQPSQDAASPPA